MNESTVAMSTGQQQQWPNKEIREAAAYAINECGKSSLKSDRNVKTFW